MPAAGKPAPLTRDLVIPDKREYAVNPAVAPCNDFYQYACSKELENIVVPIDQSRWAPSFSDAQERIRRKKQAYFASLATRATFASIREKRLADSYAACLDVSAKAREEREYAAKIQTQLKGISTNKQLASALGSNLLDVGPSFIGGSPLPNADDANTLDWIVSGGLISLPDKSYYDDDKLIADYEDLMALFFAEIGASDGKITDTAVARKRAGALVSFERAEAKKEYSKVEQRALLQEKIYVSRKELQSRYPAYDWKPMLARIPANVKLRVYGPKSLSSTEQAVAHTPLATLKDKFFAEALFDLAKESSPKFDTARRAFRAKHFSMPTAEAPLPDRCAQTIQGAYVKELDATLLPSVFPNFPREKVVALGERVRASLLSSIQSAPWLGAKTKAEAVRKIRLAKLFLVAPTNDREWGFLPEHAIDRATPVANSFSRQRAQIAKALAKLGRPANKDEWEFGPLTVNAMYSSLSNKFVLPAAILQAPFYSPDASDEQNFGGIGAVIGHELGHAVDDQGAAFDADGRLHNWFGAEEKKHFLKLQAAISKQMTDAKHEGGLVLGETIGDLVGLTTAYDAVFPKGEGTREKKQAFFLQWGRNWCQAFKPGFDTYLKKNDPHPLGEARTNEIVKHLKGFEEAFACKSGDPMTLPEAARVRVW